MPANYKACLIVIVTVIVANLMCKLVFPSQKQTINRIMAGWILLTLMLFLTPTAPVYFLSSAIILLILAPKPIDDKLQFYFAMLVAVPTAAVWRISLPGIETLLELDHVKTLSLTLLIPIYFLHKANNHDSNQHPSSDLQSKRMFGMFFSFLLIAMLMDLRATNATTALRNIFGTYLDVIILVLVVFKFCRDMKIVDKVLFAILISGVSVAFISCIQAVMSWNFYSQDNLIFFVEGEDTGSVVSFYRSGVLRTSSTMGTASSGLYLSFCLVLNHYFSGLKRRGNAEYGGSLFISIVLIAGVFLTGSRGAWLAVTLMFGLIILMQKRFRFLRGLAGLGVVIAIFSLPEIIDILIASDPYGTFQYRVDLFHNSLIAIKDNIYFGSKFFIDHPALQASIQGQGIIDIVNSYVGFALNYGVPMLALLVLVLFKVIVRLVKLRKQAENSQGAQLIEWQARTILAIIVGAFIMVATVSLVDRIAQYLWVSLVLGMCVYRYGYSEQGMKLENND